MACADAAICVFCSKHLVPKDWVLILLAREVDWNKHPGCVLSSHPNTSFFVRLSCGILNWIRQPAWHCLIRNSQLQTLCIIGLRFCSLKYNFIGELYSKVVVSQVGLWQTFQQGLP